MRTVIVKTCPTNAERVGAIEDTWAPELRANGVTVRYMSGGCMRDRITDCSISLRTAADYRHTSLRLIRALTSLMTETRGEPTLSVFVCDDDTYVNPSRFLKHDPANFEGLLWYPICEAENNVNDSRPWIAGGAGWWMDRKLCDEYCRRGPTKHADDVCVSQVAHKIGVVAANRPDLYSQIAGRVSHHNQLITCHYCEPNEMLNLHYAMGLEA